ncbi:hypothetical protein COSO111634_21230 [Corallococcus soli]
MVQVEHQDVLLLVELQQQRTLHGAVGEREGLADLGLDAAARLLLALVKWQGAQVHALQRQGPGRRDGLEGLARLGGE